MKSCIFLVYIHRSCIIMQIDVAKREHDVWESKSLGWKWYGDSVLYPHLRLKKGIFAAFEAQTREKHRRNGKFASASGYPEGFEWLPWGYNYAWRCIFIQIWVKKCSIVKGLSKNKIRVKKGPIVKGPTGQYKPWYKWNPEGNSYPEGNEIPWGYWQREKHYPWG